VTLAQIDYVAKAVIGGAALTADTILATPLIPLPPWLHGVLGVVITVAGVTGIYVKGNGQRPLPAAAVNIAPKPGV